jgi:hypothetical protein
MFLIQGDPTIVQQEKHSPIIVLGVECALIVELRREWGERGHLLPRDELGNAVVWRNGRALQHKV